MATIEMREYSRSGKTIQRFKATVTVKGFRRVSMTFDRKTDASEWAKKTEYELKHQRAFGQPDHKAKTLNEAIDRYLTGLATANAGRHRGVAPLLNWWCRQIGHIKLGEVTKDRVLQERDRLKAMHVKGNPELPKLSNARVNRYVAALKRVLNVATTEWDWIGKNQLDGIEMLPEPTGRTRFLQENELLRLMESVRKSENPDLEAIVALAISTGARRGEIETIRLGDVDMAHRKILIRKTKNGKPRILHLAEPALSLIGEIVKRPLLHNESFIFASPIESSRPNSFRRSWNTALRRASISDFRFHDLRHTAASYFAQNKAGLHQISELLGHSSYQVTRRYTHLVEKDMAAIVEQTASKVFCHDQQRRLEDEGQLQLPEAVQRQGA